MDLRAHRVEALVLRAIPYGESDAVVHLLVLGHGRIPAFARGARTSRKRFGGALEVFTRIEALLKEGPELWALREATVLEAHARLRDDLHRPTRSSSFSKNSSRGSREVPPPARGCGRSSFSRWPRRVWRRSWAPVRAVAGRSRPDGPLSIPMRAVPSARNASSTARCSSRSDRARLCGSCASSGLPRQTRRFRPMVRADRPTPALSKLPQRRRRRRSRPSCATTSAARSAAPASSTRWARLSNGRSKRERNRRRTGSPARA